MYTLWCVVGDDFHVARWMFADFPINLTELPNSVTRELLPLVETLEKAMMEATSFKLNAGRKVGNYNLAKCRHVTDISDQVFAKYLGLDKVWDDIQLLYTQMVKTSFEDNESE